MRCRLTRYGYSPITGGGFRLKSLRIACGVSRDGSKASNILKAARQYGLAAKGFKKEPEQLHGFAAAVDHSLELQSFRCLRGVSPRLGHHQRPGDRPPPCLCRAELSEAFTGVVLTFEPTAEFRRAGAPPRAIPILWRQLHGIPHRARCSSC